MRWPWSKREPVVVAPVSDVRIEPVGSGTALFWKVSWRTSTTPRLEFVLEETRDEAVVTARQIDPNWTDTRS